MPLTKRTESVMARSSTRVSVTPPGIGLVTRTSSRSRSVASLAKASNKVEMPFIGVSALAMATTRGRKPGAAVDGERVVDPGHQRQPACPRTPQAVAQGLVVVDDVEVSV